jgi:hypothetical protein
MPPKQLLRYIKDDLKRLMETIPRVPQDVIERYKKEIIPTSGDVSHPDITNGIHRVQMYTPKVTSTNEPSSPKRVKVTLSQPV